MRSFRLGTTAIAVAVIVVHVGVLAWLAAVRPWTVDEPFYLRAAVAIRETLRFDVFHAVLHGPLPYHATQLAAEWLVPVEPIDGYRFAGRLGMLPFAALAAWCTFALGRDLFGPRAGLVALVLHTANPIVLANGCLMTADTALTALQLVVVRAAWAWLREPTPWRLVGVGVALGLALATKYLALLLIPVLLVALVASPLRRRIPIALLVVAVVATVVLHACYAFRAGGYAVRTPPPGEVLHPQDPRASPISGAVRGFANVPGGAALLAVLPDPWVRGIDFQKWQSEQPYESMFLGRFGHGDPAYYVVAFGVKLPLGFLVLLLIGALGLLRGPPWPATAKVLFAAAIVIPVGYPSLFSSLQGGVRYALAVTPLLAILAARGAVAAFVRGRVARVVALVACVAAIVPAITAFPRHTAYFNALAGGQPYRIVVDSSLDWPAGDLRGDELAVLVARNDGARRLPAGQGPTLGRHALYGPHLAPRDPYFATRARHWLWAFEPVDTVGAWFLFDVDAASFAAAVAGADDADERARRALEFAIALAAADPSGRAPHAALADAVRAAGSGAHDADLAAITTPGDPCAPRRRAAWTAFGRHDIVAACVDAPLLERALAYASLGAFRAAADLFAETASRRSLTVDEALAFVVALRHEDRIDDAIDVLTRHRAIATDPQRAIVDRWLSEFEARRRAR